jgi:O-antigen/teichoic acid export membrane protein
MRPADRVIKNTGFLYGQMLIGMVISMYSTRLILNALGEVDYGIYNLIGGVIALLSFINSAMIVATGRYLSFYLGSGDEHKLKAVFSSSVVLHFTVSLFVVLVLEVGGLFLFDGALNIPAERIQTAKYIFHFMVISTFFTINAVPYDASISSHENFLFASLIAVLESFIKLGIAIVIINADVDKLVLYGLLIALMVITARVVKSIYCHRNYAECRIRVKSYIQIGLLKEMLSFAGWNLFGLFCYVLRNQGTAIILNRFFGIIINAGYGIANQVSGMLSSFSTNMIRAFLPQIFKSGGGGDRERMLRLSVVACKLSFYLLAFFAVPIIIEMPFVLTVWLKTVPENTIVFCRLILILSLLQQITVGLMAAITTIGDIKTYQIVIGTFQIFNLPVAWLLIKIGLPAYSVLVGSIFLEAVANGVVIRFAHTVAGLDVKDFVINTLIRVFLSVSIAASIAFLVNYMMNEGYLRAFLVGIASSLFLLILGIKVALTPGEYAKIRETVLSFYVRTKERLLPARN